MSAGVGVRWWGLLPCALEPRNHFGLTSEEESLAVRATRVLGLGVCGVDILRGKGGPVIMEMNANPGLEGITSVTGIDVAAEMIRYAALVAHKNIQNERRK